MNNFFLFNYKEWKQNKQNSCYHQTLDKLTIFWSQLKEDLRCTDFAKILTKTKTVNDYRE